MIAIKVLITFILVGVCFLVSGQPYPDINKTDQKAQISSDLIFPLVKEGMEWSVTIHGSGGSPPPYSYTYTSTRYKLMGDSLLNGLNYKKFYYCNEEIPVTWNYAGLMRETPEGKVYFWNHSHNIDVIEFDFSLEEGDTMTYWWPDSTFSKVFVFQKDSVLINGFYHDRLKISNQMYSPWIIDTWIEGVGSLVCGYSSYPDIILGSVYELLCAFDNNIQLYQNPNLPYCFMNTVGIPVIGNQEPVLAPNPVTSVSEFKVTGNYSGSANLYIYDIFGRIAINTIESDIGSLQIFKSDLLQGVYFYKLMINQRVYNGKFIVD